MFDLNLSRRALMFLPCLLALTCVTTAPAAAAVDSRVSGQSLVAADPLDPTGYIAYANWLDADGELERAIEILEAGRTKANPSPDLLVALGRLYEKNGKTAKAESVTREALVLDEKHVAAHVRMGEIYMRLGWPKSAIESFATAAELAPDQTMPKVRMIGGLLDWGKYSQAEDQCLQFIAGDAENPELWLSLGQVFEKQDKLREAFATYGQALTIDPGLAEAYARQGRLFCRFGQFGAGEESCRQALQLDEDNLIAHAYLGIACSKLGNGDEARVHARIAEAGGLNMTAVWRILEK